MASLRQQVFRRKPVLEMEAESGSETDRSELSRSIGLFQLSMFGVGATIGTVVWVAVALVWYFFYGFKHSHLGRHEHVGLSDGATP